MGQFWDPMGLIFRCFSWIPILPCFLVNFVTNLKKTKKVKSAQNTAPVHRFRGSPGWKNSARFWKHASIFWSNFHPKLMKIQARKWEKRSSLEKSIQNRFLAPFFGPRINFWSILGSQRGPQNCQKVTRVPGEWGLRRACLKESTENGIRISFFQVFASNLTVARLKIQENQARRDARSA